MNRLIFLNIKREAALVQDAKKVFKNIFELKQFFSLINVQFVEICIGDAHHKFEDIEKNKLLLVNLDRVVIQLAVHQRLEKWPRVVILTLLSVLAGRNHKILIWAHMIKNLIKRADGNSQKITWSRHISNNLLLHDV